MNQKIKKQWVDALKSGTYKQGQGKLRSKENTYCCLGVLCDIYHKEVGEEWTEDSIGYNMLERSTTLPEEIANWAELDTTNPMLDSEKQICAIGANDNYNLNFDEIGSLIEKNL